MADILFYNILLLATGMLYFFGGYLILGRVPRRLKNGKYTRSRKIMGLANLVLALVMTLFYCVDIKSMDIFLSPAINLVSYFIVSILIAVSFIPLLGGGTIYYTRKRIKISISFWVVYTIVLFSVVNLCDDNIVMWAMIIAAILFLGNTVGLIHMFVLTYRDALKSVENFYSDNVEVNISWMMHSIYLVIGLGLTGGLAAFGSFAPRWTAMGYLLFTLYVFGYIFVRFIDFMVFYSDISCAVVNCKEVELIPELEEHPPLVLRSDIALQISKGLEDWVEAKKYMIHGVNIQYISNYISTNRTYLSNYINSTYGLTFKDWFTSLRIEEAKRLMLEDTSVTVAEIAHRVGFSSPTSFTRAFTRRESMSPLKWRESAV